MIDNSIVLLAEGYDPLVTGTTPDTDISELKATLAEAYDLDTTLFDLWHEGQLLDERMKVSSTSVTFGAEIYSEPSEKARAITTLGRVPSELDLQLAIQSMEDIEPYFAAGLSVNCLLPSKMNPLRASITSGNESAALELLKYPEINLSDDSSQNALIDACAAGMHSVVVILLERDPSIVDTKNSYFMTPLTRACDKGHLAIVKELLKFSANANTPSPMGTPLMIAGIRGHTDIVRELLKVPGINVSLRLGNGTALHDACSFNRYEIAKLLLSMPGISVNTVCQPWGTALHNAVRKHNITLVEILVSRADINPNATDSHGNTPLHVAANKGFNEVAAILLTHKRIDLHSRNIQGETPLDCAKNHFHSDVADQITIRMVRDRAETQCKTRVSCAVAVAVLAFAFVRFRPVATS